MATQAYVAIWLLINLFAIGVYDVVATFNGHGLQTVSSVIYSWAGRWPLLAAFIGGLVIHLLGLGPREKLP